MADILVADRIIVTSDIGNCEIHLCVGDIIKLPIKDKVDVLVISAFPGNNFIHVENVHYYFIVDSIDRIFIFQKSLYA